jgi:hypothetical protein
MAYLKQSDVAKTKKKREPKMAVAVPMDRAADYAESDYRHSGCVEEALDGLTSVISTYVRQARDGDNGSSLFTDPSGYPARVELSFEYNDDGPTFGIHIPEEALDALNSIAESFKRIADAMTGRIDNATTPDNPHAADFEPCPNRRAGL